MEVLIRSEIAKLRAPTTARRELPSQREMETYSSWDVQPEQVYEKLVALGDNPSPEDIDQILDQSWTCSLFCHAGCGQYREAVIAIGGGFDDDGVVYICAECLKSGLEMLGQS